MSDCNNNCEAVAGLHEAAANLIQYRNLINSWLNGGQNQTVNIGGQNIPTLLGLAMSIKQLVGVWPDDITIKINPVTKKIYVPLKTNGGVHVDTSGLYIDSSDFLQLGGGLAKDSSGNIYVDFDQMPTTKFDSILETFRKGLRLPKWLTANKNFYVDKNHAAASDTLDEGRGESPSLPFKTIQACVNYVCNNFNLGPYACYIYINSGVYEEYINLPAYTATTGNMTLRPYDIESGNRVTIRNPDGKNNYVFKTTATQTYNIFFIDFELKVNPATITSRTWGAPFYCNGAATISLYGCAFDVVFESGAIPSGGVATFYNLMADSGSNVRILHSETLPTRITAPASKPANTSGYMFYINNAELALGGLYAAASNHKIQCGGDYNIVAHSLNKGMIHQVGGSASFFQFEEISGNPVKGYRYDVRGGGTINTGGMGPEYFPGSIAGTVESSTYSWYK